MRRIATVVAALMLPMQAQALGVGEIESYSALNQPLEAEIGLFSVGSINQNDIRVKLAPFEAYEQAGIEYPSVLSSLKFSVEERPDGEFYIRVHSKESVQDPFLDILLAIDWPSGHLMREYTMLLDLPVMTDEVVGAVSAPETTIDMSATSPSMVEGSGYVGSVSSAPESTQDKDVPLVPAAEPIYAETTSQMGSGNLRVGMVKRGDTLWGIAESMRTDRSVTVQQIMIALLKNNPEAFYDNNINNLKAGYVLRLDNPELITALSPAQASREAQRQFQAWKSGRQGQSNQMTQGSNLGDGTAGAASLRLISPDDADSILSRTASGDSQTGSLSSEGLEALRQELNYALDTSDSSRQENTELRARIAELEGQIGEMQRLLSLRDDALSVLQASPESESETGSDSEVDQQVAADSQAVAKAPMANKAPLAESNAKPTAQQKPVAQEESLVDMAMAYINRTVNLVTSVVSPVVLGGAVGGLLLLLGGAWFLRKRKISEDDLEQSMRVEVADKKLSDDLANGTVSDLSEPKEETSAVELLDSTEADKYEADIDEIDVMAEADVYLAYQRFDRAEELMREAIVSEPDRLDLQMKLLEVLSVSASSDAFIEAAEQFAARGGKSESAMWVKVSEMASSMGINHPIFSGSIETGESDQGDDVDLPGGDLDADLSSLDDDLMASLDEDIAAVSSVAEAEEAAESDEPVEDIEVADTLVSEAIETDGLDFDLSEHTEDASTFDSDAKSIPTVDDVDINSDSNELEYDTSDLTTAANEEPAAHEQSTDGVDEGLTLITNTVNDVEADADAEIDTDMVDADVTDRGSEVDNALDFDLGDLDLSTETAVEEIDSHVGDAGEDETVREMHEVADLDGDVDDTSASELDFISDEVESDNIDDDLSGDIDWLASAADDAVEDDDGDSFFSSEDEVATKLDLIRAYIDMGDNDSARNILAEVVEEGNDEQKNEAQEILKQID